MSIYNSEHLLLTQDPLTGKRRFSPNKLSGLVGRERKNLDRQLKSPRPSKKTIAAVENALPRIHEELPLHSYGPRLFYALRSLRDAEDRARSRLKLCATGSSAETITKAYGLALQEVCACFRETVISGTAILKGNEERGMEPDNLTTVYLAAAVLHTAIIVWEDAANAISKLADRATLDFIDLNFEDIETVVDAAERAYDLYSIAQSELHAISTKFRKLSSKQLKDCDHEPTGIEIELRDEEALRGTLARQDSEIASMQIASIASHAMDWRRAGGEYLAIISEKPKNNEKPKNFDERIRKLAEVAPIALASAITLVERLPKNLLLARNTAYMALQHDHRPSLQRAAEVLAAELNIAVSRVWRHEILGRPPLCEEVHIADKFEHSQPTLLKGDRK
jgi:hypothetical protein